VFDGSTPINTALEQLRLRLLDLTGRNRLLNFKHTAGRSLQLVPTNLEGIFLKLVGAPTARLAIAPVPEPTRDQWVERNGRMVKPDAKEFAATLGLPTNLEPPRVVATARNEDTAAQSLYFAEDLGKHCRKLEREARLAIEETGANMLYLVLGFLEFPDSKDAERLFQAPLVCLPVRFEQTQEGQRTVFKLAHTGEEVEENLSLREKLKRDYQLVIPDFPDEEEGIAGYLDDIERMVTEMPQWHVRRMMTLALLSFSNMLLVRDLDPENWIDEKGGSSLTSHPIIQELFEGRKETNASLYASEYELDELPDAEFPIIFDADSSQHSALMDVMKGRTMVIEGPPGTGKSQTITNIIAACLYSGKSVLFVAEKLAALQVVRSRLQLAGLDPFLMELHSNKTSKKQVLDSLSNRISLRAPAPRGIEDKETNLDAKKTELKRHAALLKSRIGNNLGCSVHEILWRAERPRARLAELSDTLRNIVVEAAPTTHARDYQSSLDNLRYLAGMFDEIGQYDQSHPFWGFYPKDIAPGDDLPISNILKEACGELAALCTDTTAIESEFGFLADHATDADGIKKTRSILSDLQAELTATAALDILPKIFGEQNPHVAESVREVQKGAALLARIIDLEDKIKGKIDVSRVAECDLSSEDIDFSKKFSFQSATVAELTQRTVQLQQIAAKARQAASELDGMGGEFGVGSISRTSDFNKLQALIEVATKAPSQVLELRHPGLSGTTCIDILNRSILERSRLSDRERALGEKLYLDQEPSSEELRQTILVLREGNAWYRVFQTRWRAAIRLHRTLLRRKVKMTSDERLADLEELASLRKNQSSWLDSASIKTVSGNSYQGFGTPLESLREIAIWMKSGRERLETAGVSGVTPETIAPAAVERLKSREQLFSRDVAVITSADQQVVELVPTYVADEFGSPPVDWQTKLGLLDATFSRMGRIGAALGRIVASELSVSEAFAVLDAARVLAACESELQSSRQLAEILGERFVNIRGDIGAITGAVRFGAAVSRSNLPPKLKSMLWSTSAPDVLDRISDLAKRMDGRWTAVQGSLSRLEKFGAVDVKAWQFSNSGTISGARATAEKFNVAHLNLDGLVPWSQYVHARDTCISRNLLAFVEALEDRVVASKSLTDAYAYRFHASIADSLFRQHKSLNRFTASRHNNVRSEYAEQDRELISLRGRQIAAHSVREADPPQGNTGARVDDKSEMHLIEYLRNQVRPRVTVRAMFRRAGRAIKELKPCFMMGPQAVAQFLDPRAVKFDVVIMDEASQLRPEEAIGAIARGNQLIVVGDPKQLPPTSFFSRAQPSDDGQEQMAAVDAESILDVATTHFRPVRSLRWHYRSRHESLIAFSNQKFYGGSLVVFPSPFPRSRSLGVRSHYVTGAIYENQMNQLEAMRTVDLVVDHIVTRPEQSLGVVTLNIRQRDLIDELLVDRLKAVVGADKFRDHWHKEGQPLFVKNLENVQGDERDAIIISTTFGRPPGATRPHQYFGPISQEGGWRRLNVLFTRARSSVLVVTSLKDTDIVVVPGSTPKGTEALRDYLLFASTGVLRHEHGTETDVAPESDFEIAVIRALEEHEFHCVPQVGVAGFRIDIGVRHPRYPHLFLAGIECDGASYHSGVTVRDRDRIRQEILESLGWKGKLWRIWSTEWFRNPNGEVKKLLSFLRDLNAQEIDASVAALAESWSASSADDVLEITSDSELELVSKQAASLLTDTGELEVQVGDSVSYISIDTDQERVLTVEISERMQDHAQGIIAAHSPLAQTLIGAMIDETVVLRVPSQPDRSLKIVKITRPPLFSLTS
jgi:transcription elongation GreA/GreB family factor